MTFAYVVFFHYLCITKDEYLLTKGAKGVGLANRNKDTTNIMANKKNETQVENIETTKAAIEQERELSASEILNAYMANHAVEDYCDALNESEQEVTEILDACRKEEGEYWLYTQPAIDGKKADGTPLPTHEEWEKLNPAAVRVDNLAGRQWYKRPFIIGDARGVRSIVSAYGRYQEALAGAEKKVQAMADGGKRAFATMSAEEKARYIAELQALMG